jgi:hypothetical protein
MTLYTTTWPSEGFQLLRSPFYTPGAANNDNFQAEHHNNILQAMKGNKVINGMKVKEQISPSLTVDIEAGNIFVNGTKYILAADTLDLTASVPAIAGEANYVIIYINSSGVMQYIVGIDNTLGSQYYPEILETTVPLAVILLSNGDTEINTVDIGDLRIFTSRNERIEGKLDVGGQIESLVAGGTAPFIVASNTLVSNLNADLLDGQEGSYYAEASHNHSGVYQPLDANLTTIAAISPTTDNFMVVGASDWEQKTPAQVKSILDLEIGTDIQAYSLHLAAIAGFSKTDGGFIVGDGSTYVLETGSTARTSLGLTIGSDVQAYSSHLSAIAGFSKTDGNFIVANGSTYVAESGSTARDSLGLTIGSDVQAYNSLLDSYIALSRTDGNFLVGNGSDFIAESGNTARTSLGLGSSDTPSFSGIILSGNLNLATHSITGTNVSINNSELQQLSNIGAVTISGAQWTILGGLSTSLSATELNYSSNVTSDIQAQIDAITGTSYLPLSGGAITGQLFINDNSNTINVSDMFAINSTNSETITCNYNSATVDTNIYIASSFLSTFYTGGTVEYEFGLPIPINKGNVRINITNIKYTVSDTDSSNKITNTEVKAVNIDTGSTQILYNSSSLGSSVGDKTASITYGVVPSGTDYIAVVITTTTNTSRALDFSLPRLTYHYETP